MSKGLSTTLLIIGATGDAVEGVTGVAVAKLFKSGGAAVARAGGSTQSRSDRIELDDLKLA